MHCSVEIQKQSLPDRFGTPTAPFSRGGKVIRVVGVRAFSAFSSGTSGASAASASPAARRFAAAGDADCFGDCFRLSTGLALSAAAERLVRRAGMSGLAGSLTKRPAGA